MYHIDSPALKVEHKKGMCYINAALSSFIGEVVLVSLPAAAIITLSDHYWGESSHVVAGLEKIKLAMYRK